MIHVMKLKEEYFDYILKGSKEYEIRLNDEKRSIIKKSDFIEFQKEPFLKERMLIPVDDLIYYPSFYELLNDIDIRYLASVKISKEKLLSDLEMFYSKKKQNTYGTVAIKLDKSHIVKIDNINNIDTSNELFNNLRKMYRNIDLWLDKLKDKNIDVMYTTSLDKMTSLFIIKIDEKDSNEFFEEGNILKIRSFIVSDKNKGVGTNYLKLVENIANANHINYIYLTVKKDNTELIRFLEKNNYHRYNQLNDEYVYYKDVK